MSRAGTALLHTRRGRRVTRLGHLRACLPAAGLAAMAALAVGWRLHGSAVGGGAAVGVLVAAAAFCFGVLVVDAADRVASALVLPVGLTAYAVTVVVLGAAVLRWEDSSADAVRGLPWGVVGGTAVWVAVQCWWAWTSPTPYVELPPAASEAPRAASRTGKAGW